MEEVVVEEGVEGNNKAACMEVTPGFNSAKKKIKKNPDFISGDKLGQ